MSVIDVEVVLGLTKIDVSVDAEGSKVDVIVLKDFTASNGMSKDDYDPTNVQADVFDRANHTGQQDIDSTTTGALPLSRITPINPLTILGNDSGGFGSTPKAMTVAETQALLNIEDGAEVNPDVISQAEAEAGIATTERTFTAERVKQAIDALATGEPATINSIVAGEPTGSDVVPNVVSLLQAEYDAGTPVAGTFYIITDAAASGGGGTEYQNYDLSFWVDNPSSSNWVGWSDVILGVEFQSSTGTANTASIITASGFTLGNTRPLGVAKGNQTVENFVLWNGNSTVASLTKISIIKVSFSAPNTINSVAVLYEGAISFTNGYLNLSDTDFAVTSISDQDIIMVFFATDTIADIAPMYMRLKCSID